MTVTKRLNELRKMMREQIENFNKEKTFLKIDFGNEEYSV